MKHLVVIIVNWNNWPDTIDCLHSLQKSSIVDCSMTVVVVDNKSSDNSVHELEQAIPKLNTDSPSKFVLLPQNKNLGFSGGNNCGIRYGLKNGADYCVLINSDTIVEKNLLTTLMAFLEEHDSVGIVGPKIYFAKGHEYHADRYTAKERGKVIWYAGGMIDWKSVYAYHRGVDDVDHGQYDTAQETDFVSGCCMMLRTSIVDTIGLLDDRYFLYYEDIDYCMRARQVGLGVWYVPSGFLWHKNAQSSGSPGSPLHVYYQTRNRLLFGFTYASTRTKFALLRESIRHLRNSQMQKKAVVDFYLGRLGQQDL